LLQMFLRLRFQPFTSTLSGPCTSFHSVTPMTTHWAMDTSWWWCQEVEGHVGLGAPVTHLECFDEKCSCIFGDMQCLTRVNNLEHLTILPSIWHAFSLPLASPKPRQYSAAKLIYSVSCSPSMDAGAISQLRGYLRSWETVNPHSVAQCYHFLMS
jgi:hypothetical protein